MDDDNGVITDSEYREFMLKLSRKFSSQDIEELKYILTSRLPAGIIESLDTALKVFIYLERLCFVGPNNLCELVRLFDTMGKNELSSTVKLFVFFTQNNNSLIVESL